VAAPRVTTCSGSRLGTSMIGYWHEPAHSGPVSTRGVTPDGSRLRSRRTAAITWLALGWLPQATAVVSGGAVGTGAVVGANGSAVGYEPSGPAVSSADGAPLRTGAERSAWPIGARPPRPQPALLTTTPA